jgi:Flp pilus assembly protein TadD
LDPDLAEAHASLGFIRVFSTWDPVGGEQEFRRAIELNPVNAIAHYWYVLMLVAVGRLDEAEHHYRLSYEAEPLSPVVAFGGAMTSVGRRRYEEAEDRTRKGLELDPTHPLLRMWLGVALQAQSRLDEATVEWRKAAELMPDTIMGLGCLADGLALSGEVAEARSLLDKALAIASTALTEPVSLAIMYLGLGETERAFHWLNAACDLRHGLIYFVIKTDPRFDQIRSDPRFQAVLERMGLA